MTMRHKPGELWVLRNAELKKDPRYWTDSFCLLEIGEEYHPGRLLKSDRRLVGIFSDGHITPVWESWLVETYTRQYIP